MIRAPPSSPLFPYTTLFRSACAEAGRGYSPSFASRRLRISRALVRASGMASVFPPPAWAIVGPPPPPPPSTSETSLTRSEEHTSELQSRQYLVCRLLLEKKK